MSTKYKAAELDSTYFVTITTVGWIDVFTKLTDLFSEIEDSTKSMGQLATCIQILPVKIVVHSV